MRRIAWLTFIATTIIGTVPATVRAQPTSVLPAGAAIDQAGYEDYRHGIGKREGGVLSGATFPVACALPFERFVLPNGLRLIVHEVHTVPVAQVRMFYRAGERDSGPGRAGYPHLFEHLAFSRTEHLDRSIWSFLETIGATNYDATTRYDYTHYYATVPVQALDTLLWLESERMGQLVGAVTEEDLRKSHQEVVEEATRLLGIPAIQLLRATWERTYPDGHPYAGFDIASEDLRRATLTDARSFYARYYHPANAVLVVAGAVSPEAVREKVGVRFGALPPGPIAAQSEPRIGRRSGTRRERIEGLLPGTRQRLVWSTPGWGTAAAEYVELAFAIVVLRIRGRLIANGLAAEVKIAAEMRELGGQVMLDVIARSPTVFPDIELIVREEIHRLATDGPGAAELSHAKAGRRSQCERDTSELAGVTYLLGKAELFSGHASHLQTMALWTATATTEDIRRAVDTWLTGDVTILEFTTGGQP